MQVCIGYVRIMTWKMLSFVSRFHFETVRTGVVCVYFRNAIVSLFPHPSFNSLVVWWYGPAEDTLVKGYLGIISFIDFSFSGKTCICYTSQCDAKGQTNVPCMILITVIVAALLYQILFREGNHNLLTWMTNPYYQIYLSKFHSNSKE